MAFRIQNWNRMSASANEPLVTIPPTGTIVQRDGSFRVYNYFGVTYTAGAITGDSQATMATVSYFDTVAFDLQVGDLILAYSASENTYQYYQVTAISAANVVTVAIYPLVGNHIEADVTIASADVLTLNSAPPTLVAAPGAGFFIQVHDVALIMDFGGIAYTDTGVLQVRWFGGTARVATEDMDGTGFLDAAADAFTFAGPIDMTAVNAYPLADIANRGIQLFCTAADPAAGTGVIRAKVFYSIVPTGV